MSNESWSEMLDNVEQMLNRSATAAEEREQGAGAVLSVSDTDRAAGWRQFLEQLEQHLGGLQRCTEQATAAGAVAEAELGASQEAVGAWLQARAALARKLADQAGPGV